MRDRFRIVLIKTRRRGSVKNKNLFPLAVEEPNLSKHSFRNLFFTYCTRCDMTETMTRPSAPADESSERRPGLFEVLRAAASRKGHGSATVVPSKDGGGWSGITIGGIRGRSARPRPGFHLPPGCHRLRT